MSSEPATKRPPFVISFTKGDVMINFTLRIEHNLPPHSMGREQKIFPVQVKLGRRLLDPPLGSRDNKDNHS